MSDGQIWVQVVLNSIFFGLHATSGRRTGRVMVTAHQLAKSRPPAPLQFPQGHSRNKEVKMG
jgi:hypothetical protein